MIKLIVAIKRKRGMSAEAFRDYYETRHVPFCEKLLPPMAIYRRNYVVTDDPLVGGVGEDRAMDEDDYDVFTEAIFQTRAEAQTFLDGLFRPEILTRIQADEANFMEPGTVKFYLVDSRESARKLSFG